MEFIKKISVLLLMSFFLVGCENTKLKRSAGNKLFDTRGFDGDKRKPIYNEKYISIAKRNILENDTDDDGDLDDEYLDPYTKNRMMYSAMIEEERAKRRKKRGNIRSEIGYARDQLHEDSGKTDDDLKLEIMEIKKMLSEAKEDLVKSRCPLQERPDDLAQMPRPRTVQKKINDDFNPTPKPFEDGEEDDYDNLYEKSSKQKKRNKSKKQVVVPVNQALEHKKPLSNNIQPKISHAQEQSTNSVGSSPVQQMQTNSIAPEVNQKSLASQQLNTQTTNAQPVKMQVVDSNTVNTEQVMPQGSTNIATEVTKSDISSSSISSDNKTLSIPPKAESIKSPNIQKPAVDAAIKPMPQTDLKVPDMDTITKNIPTDTAQ